MTSLTLVRRIAARPSIVFDALTRKMQPTFSSSRSAIQHRSRSGSRC